MAPLNYQHQHDRHLEDGLAPYGDEKAALKGDTLPQTTTQQTQSPKSKCRAMNPKRSVITIGLGLLVGFGLVSANRSRPHRALCSHEIHAANEHEIKALVEQTKDDTSALSEILRCASPETFHRLVSVYFPERTKQESENGRAEAIGTDEAWLVTAWEKLVKRQDDGSGEPSTPSDSATDAGAGVVTETTTVAADPPTTSDPVVEDPTTTDPGSNPEPTTSDPPSIESTTEATSESTTSSQTTTSSEPELTSSDEEPDRPSRTTIHMSSSAVKETFTSVREDGGTTTITSTSWVAVDPPKNTDESESDPSLQDAGPSLRANVGPALLVGGLVTMLLMS
ncbi:hypothetical protein CC79DRAFT_769069 [Sarocladium strictum]